VYTVDALDTVIALEDLPRSDVGAPSPVVLADEFSTVVAYCVLDGEQSAVETLTDGVPEDGEPMVVVQFAGRRAHMFGPPNDEAFAGHPLAARGLHPYGAFRIERSSWIRGLERMNSVHRHHRPEAYAQLSHFVLSFHDSTFECVARELQVFPRYARTAFVVQRMLKILKGAPGSNDFLG
jgi:hypothetical protein